MVKDPTDETKSPLGIRHLRQSDAVWLCTARRAPFWIMPKDRPAYRPYVVLVQEQDTERIRHTHTQDERPTSEAILQILVKAMRSPLLGPFLSPLLGFGSPSRPARILLDNTDLVQALAPRLSDVGIRCAYRAILPQINAALREMEAHVTKREPVPGLLSVPRATVALVGEFFSAAADYSRVAPWRWMDNHLPIEIRYPPQARARYALVLGSGGETFGLSLYESLADIELVYSAPAAQRGKVMSWFSLVLDEATAMSFDDLDAMDKYDWPLAGKHAYPLAMKIISTSDHAKIPNASELAWLTATVRVIPDFVLRCLRSDRGAPQPAQVVYSLPGVHGGQEILLRYPAQERMTPEDEEAIRSFGAQMKYSPREEPIEDDRIEQDLEEFIRDWYSDEPSHKFAREMGLFLFRFLDDLESIGISPQTLRKHTSNCWLIGKFECDYGYHKNFSPKIFLGGPSFLYEFKRKVSDSKYAVNSYTATWRKLERYVQSGAALGSGGKKN
jgi:Domain of unknown function (DUF6930)